MKKRWTERMLSAGLVLMVGLPAAAAAPKEKGPRPTPKAVTAPFTSPAWTGACVGTPPDGCRVTGHADASGALEAVAEVGPGVVTTESWRGRSTAGLGAEYTFGRRISSLAISIDFTSQGATAAQTGAADGRVRLTGIATSSGCTDCTATNELVLADDGCPPTHMCTAGTPGQVTITMTSSSGSLAPGTVAVTALLRSTAEMLIGPGTASAQGGIIITGITFTPKS